MTRTFHTSHQHIMLTLLFQYVTGNKQQQNMLFHTETTEEVTLLFSESQHKMSLTRSLCRGVLVLFQFLYVILVALTKPARANPDCAFVRSAGRTHSPPTRQRRGVLGKGPTRPLGTKMEKRADKSTHRTLTRHLLLWIQGFLSVTSAKCFSRPSTTWDAELEQQSLVLKSCALLLSSYFILL